MPFYRTVITALLFIVFTSSASSAKITLPLYAQGIALDTNAIKQQAKVTYDSVMKHHAAIANKQVIFSIMPYHQYVDKTVDFYLLLALFIFLGLVRFSDPRYFTTLWQSFKSPLMSGKQMKEKLDNATVQNLLMNLFFVFSMGAWLYYVIRLFNWNYASRLSPILLISILSLGVMMVYAGKYVAIRFSGWAFRVEHITDHYLFNVFFINKILAISLLPLTLLMAFGTNAVANVGNLLSLLLVLFLLATRYMRSWQVFGSFFQYSKFHFFMYLCASELLPLAVLVKLIVIGLP